MKKLACVLALTGAFASFDALAWGNHGHRAIGAIADKLIKGSNAEKQVAALLKPGESLESISVWADCVKGDWCGPQTPEMVEYVGANPAHNTYHYTNVPFQHDHYHAGAVGTHEDDIVQTLKQAIAVLQGKTGPEVNPHNFSKRQALMLLVHMTGDIHQPLHVGAGYVNRDSKFVVPKHQHEVDDKEIFNSRGGNNLTLDEEMIEALAAGLIPPGEPKPIREGVPKALTKPFHSYWDTTTVDYAFRRIKTKTPKQFADAAIASTPQVGKNTGEPVTWPYQWADDALAASKIAHEGVVPGKLVPQVSKKGETYYTFTLEVPQNYPVPSSALAKTQLIKGGYKLAEVLQAIFPESAR